MSGSRRWLSVAVVIFMTWLVSIFQVGDLKIFLDMMGVAETTTHASVYVNFTDNVTYWLPSNITSDKATSPSSSLRDEDQSQSSPNQNNTTMHPELGRYLQYFVQGGWGNQVQCLSSAYAIAWATNRTLILAPMVPHFRLHYHQIVVDMDTQQYQTDYDLKHAYLSKLQSSRDYIRMDQVLDVDYSLPLVSSIDFRDFYRNVFPFLSSADVWVMETEYSHFNTHWMVSRPELEGLSETIHAIEHGHDMNYTVTIRDLPMVGRAREDFVIWTLLDSFRAFPLEAQRGTAMSQIQRPRQMIMNPRFCHWIRQSAHRILDQYYNWDMGTLPYASIHIRGSDGPFKEDGFIAKTIRQDMDNIATAIQFWLSNTTTHNISYVGLFVATDISGLESRTDFSQRLLNLNETLQSVYNTTLRFLQSQDIEVGLQKIYKTDLDFPYEKTDIPGLLLDQQVAACAGIGFLGTRRSSFSRFISTLRRDRAKACVSPEY